MLLQNRRPEPEKDRLILENLLFLKEFREADLLLSYVSVGGEIDTLELLMKCFEMKKRVAVPKTGAQCMDFYEISGLSELEKTEKCAFNIPEPVNSCKKAQINSSAFCVVPALACDMSGFRIGYGKGYYDRFLAGYDGMSAVLCYHDNIREIPVEAHDRAVSLIVTERGILHGR
jgi:5-formyltetrahydrofolate cyclo-ligase